MEELQEQLPKGIEQMKDTKEQLQKLREEKRLIRQIKRMDQEHLATYEFAHPFRGRIRNRHVPKFGTERKEADSGSPGYNRSRN